MSVVTAHMVYFYAFARSDIFQKNARKSGVGRGQFEPGVNGLNNISNVIIQSMRALLHVDKATSYIRLL